jgi:hypothetical protein
VPEIAETHQKGYLLPFDAIKNGPKLMIKIDPYYYTAESQV